MEEAKALNHVAAFHRTFNLPVEDQPLIPGADRCALRVNLLTEELEELKEAIRDNDLVGIADALCDLQYVLSGAILEFGMGESFSALFNEVQRSNMSKVCATRQEAEDTLEYYARERQQEGRIVEKDGRFIVYRTADSKVLKSVNYSEADLETVLHRVQALSAQEKD